MDIIKTCTLPVQIMYFLFISMLILILIPRSAVASYEFDKIRIGLSQKNPIESIKLSNPGKDTVVDLQVQAVAWSQEKGIDIYKPTKDLIIAPPIMKIPPGKSQLVRVGWRTPVVLSQERSYRIFIQDLTSYKQPKNTILFKVQASMPVFIEPTTPVYEAKWQIKRDGNQLKVILSNTGNMHLQIIRLTLTDANKKLVAKDESHYYLLPQQTKENVLAVKNAPTGLITITAKTDNGELIATVPIS